MNANFNRKINVTVQKFWKLMKNKTLPKATNQKIKDVCRCLMEIFLYKQNTSRLFEKKANMESNPNLYRRNIRHKHINIYTYIYIFQQRVLCKKYGNCNIGLYSDWICYYYNYSPEASPVCLPDALIYIEQCYAFWTWMDGYVFYKRASIHSKHIHTHTIILYI